MSAVKIWQSSHLSYHTCKCTFRIWLCPGSTLNDVLISHMLPPRISAGSQRIGQVGDAKAYDTGCCIYTCHTDDTSPANARASAFHSSNTDMAPPQMLPTLSSTHALWHIHIKGTTVGSLNFFSAQHAEEHSYVGEVKPSPAKLKTT